MQYSKLWRIAEWMPRRRLEKLRRIRQLQSVANIEFGGVAKSRGAKWVTAIVLDKHFPRKYLALARFATGPSSDADHRDGRIVFMVANGQHQDWPWLGGRLQARIFGKAAPNQVAWLGLLVPFWRGQAPH
jgi:hypothetical protein